MKWRLLLIFLFTGMCAPALDWGVLDDYVENNTPGNVHSRYLMKPILEGRAVRVFLDGLAEEEVEEREAYARLIEQMYTDWFLQAARAIRKEKREAEFADILPLLDKRVNFEFVPGNVAYDIKFNFKDNIREIRQQCGKAAAACYLRGEETVIVVTRHLTTKQKIALKHEIGHSLGFSDQYEPLNGNIGRNNSHAVYSTPESQRSIMGNLSLKGFQCGDVDGMINLIDITRGKFHGGREGWRSFCKKKPRYYYVNGKAELKPYEILKLENDGIQLVINQPDGKTVVRTLQTNQGPSLRADTVFTPVETDKQGRVLRAAGNHGETKYCMYSYESKICVVTQGDAWMKFEKRYNTRRVVLKKLRVLKNQFLLKEVLLAAEGQVSRVLIGQFNERERGIVFSSPDEEGYLAVSVGKGYKILQEEPLRPIGQEPYHWRDIGKNKKLSREETLQERLREAKWETLKAELIKLAFEE